MMMQATNTIEAESEACRYIVDLIYQRCGICLHEGKEALIKARLGKRMRQLGHASLAEYCGFLQSCGNGEELELVTDALATNFTGFLREESHFKFVVDEALPALLSADPARIRVWSAACSSGEEPYSIAFYLCDRLPPEEGWDWQITASDISTKVLGKARRGVYAADRLLELPPEWLRRVLSEGDRPMGRQLSHQNERAHDN